MKKGMSWLIGMVLGIVSLIIVLMVFAAPLVTYVEEHIFGGILPEEDEVLSYPESSVMDIPFRKIIGTKEEVLDNLAKEIVSCWNSASSRNIYADRSAYENKCSRLCLCESDNCDCVEKNIPYKGKLLADLNEISNSLNRIESDGRAIVVSDFRRSWNNNEARHLLVGKTGVAEGVYYLLCARNSAIHELNDNDVEIFLTEDLSFNCE